MVNTINRTVDAATKMIDEVGEVVVADAMASMPKELTRKEIRAKRFEMPDRRNQVGPGACWNIMYIYI